MMVDESFLCEFLFEEEEGYLVAEAEEQSCQERLHDERFYHLNGIGL